MVCSIFRQRKKNKDPIEDMYSVLYLGKGKNNGQHLVHFVQSKEKKSKVKDVFESYVYRRGECTCMYIKKY